MKKSSTYMIFLLTLLSNSIIAIQLTHALEAKPTKNILLVNSYHQSLSWTNNQSQGIIDGLDESHLSYELFIEYMDTKRKDTQMIYNPFKTFIKKKYASRPIDLIMVTDNDALILMEDMQPTHFPNVPVVFSGINNQYEFKPHFTGVIEEVNLELNLELIQLLHPNTDTVFLVLDLTTTGVALINKVKATIQNESLPFRLKILSDYSINELRDYCSNLSNKSVVLFLLFNMDREGQYFSYEDALSHIAPTVSVPIYGTWDFYLEHGIVGGRIISGYSHGRLAGEIAADILKGSPVHLPPPTIGPTQYVFNFEKLKHNGISITTLPSPRTILGTPYSTIKENWRLISFFLVVITAMATLIILLYKLNHYKRNQLNIERKHNQTLNEQQAQIEAAKEKAEEANRLKSAFLANMSHEIRTPMNGIVGFSQLLRQTEDLPQEKISQYVNVISSNSQILLNIINDIIDISKIEANQLDIHYAPCDIHRIILEMFFMFNSDRVRLGKNSIKMSMEVPTDKQQLVVLSDADRIRQVLINLLSNAIKFTDTGSISIGYKHDDSMLYFFVRDTGIGLPKNKTAIIFDRFRQADESSSRRYGGSGLGLAICKGILTKMNGDIWVESELGKGSTFWFSIPFDPVEPGTADRYNSAQARNRISVNWKTKRVLIVEDVEESYLLLKEYLEPTLIKILYVTNGEDAVIACKKDSSIDLVLMDLQLPGMDGYQTTKRIKEFRPDLPIIAQTANAMSEDRNKTMAAGCDEHISKPIKGEQLINILSRFLT